MTVNENITVVFVYSTEENFKNEGRPDKWIELSVSTIKQRNKNKQCSGLILQITYLFTSSVNTYYDNNSAVIGSRHTNSAEMQDGINLLKSGTFLPATYP